MLVFYSFAFHVVIHFFILGRKSVIRRYPLSYTLMRGNLIETVCDNFSSRRRLSFHLGKIGIGIYYKYYIILLSYYLIMILVSYYYLITSISITSIILQVSFLQLGMVRKNPYEVT